MKSIKSISNLQTKYSKSQGEGGEQMVGSMNN